MYAKNSFSKRRTSGWAERRRYFRHLIAQARVKASRDPETEKAPLVIDKA
jgi:hypothetical protein